jgi:RNA polymerase sigma factor (sigma-70 family)
MFGTVSDDVSLLAAWRDGNASAGETLIGRHYDAVLRFFRTKAFDDADDLAQRTFLRCVEPAAGFRGDSTFRAYLFGIARNVLFEHIRSRMRDRKVDPDYGVSAIVDLNPGASTIAFRRGEQRRLVHALQKVPLEIQMALELFYWEELSVEELARALDVPPGTVKSRLHRGRSLLREAMESLPMDAGPDSGRAELERWASDVRKHLPGDSEPPA